MDKKKIIQDTAAFVKQELENEGSGHDWFHIERVWNSAKHIAAVEGADEFICSMTSLLHDMADDKIFENTEERKQLIINWLHRNNVIVQDAEHILGIIDNMSFSSQGELLTLEGQVVQDADRLDAIGAIGIARCFQFSGHKGQAMYDPNIAVREEMTKAQYRQEKSTAINHFYEKLFKLKGLMNTNTGKALAEERHAYMQSFVEQFMDEWKGRK